MKWGIVVTIVLICLLIGATTGYFTGYLKYEPIVRGLELNISHLRAQVVSLEQTASSLSQTISTQEVQISNQEIQISNLETELSVREVQIRDQEAQISTLKSEKDNLQTELSEAKVKLKDYENELSNKEKELSSIKSRLNYILGITARQNYHWNYGWDSWQWELQIPLSIYVEYLERPRPATFSNYVELAKDPKDDYYIDYMVQQINNAAQKKYFTDIQKLNFVIAFVQSLPYTVDVETTPYDEYPRYPVQTLFDRGGDCEDTSILVAALLDRMGYDVALLILQNAKHMAVGVSLPVTYGFYYEYYGKRYFYLETTGEGWEVGQIPPNITDTSAYIYPLKR